MRRSGAALTHAHYTDGPDWLPSYAGGVSNTRGTALVVGAGVIGSTSAFRLARDGWRVTLFDPAPGHGATWAAAGMIAPQGEVAPGEFENYRRQRDAVASWQDLAEELFDVTSCHVSVVQTGTLFVGLDGGDRQLVDQVAHVADDFGASSLRVSRDTHDAFFQDVTPRIREGLYFEGDGWINPDEALKVLSVANEKLGVEVIRETVTSVTVEENHVVAMTDSGSFGGDVGILATGAQPLPSGVVQHAEHMVRPVRGMTVRVEGLDRSDQPTLRAFVRGRSWYLVSRPNGYCVIGASSDEQGTLGVELGEAQRLFRDSLEVVPSLETASLVEIREGLRPASKDLEPFFEVIDERWAWLSGHYRHGVTLAPSQLPRGRRVRAEPLVIRFNGTSETFVSENVVEFLARHAIDARGIAVAIDGDVVRRGDWPTTLIPDGTQIEVVTAVAGG